MFKELTFIGAMVSISASVQAADLLGPNGEVRFSIGCQSEDQTAVVEEWSRRMQESGRYIVEGRKEDQSKVFRGVAKANGIISVDNPEISIPPSCVVAKY